jgi:HEAT repeat protein
MLNYRLRPLSAARALYGVCGILLLAAAAQAAAPTIQSLVDALKSPDQAAQLKAIDSLGAKGAKAAEAVPALTDLLKSPAAAVRAHAAGALGQIGVPAKSAAPALAELLKDADDTVRRQAVKAVTRIRPGPQVMVPLCMKLLDDADPGVRIRILQAIADAGPAAVPGLIEALKNDKVEYWACLALREIGPKAKAAVPALIEELKGPRPEMRREAALSLGAMKEAAAPAVPPLAALLGDEHVRVAATLALGQIGQIPASAEAQVRANARDANHLLSTVSLWALAMARPDDKNVRREAAELLMTRLKDPDAFVRLAAARGLAALPPDPEIMVPLWEKALQDADEATVHHALDALAALGPKAVPRLIDALKHEKLRGQIVYVLGQIGPEAAPATDALVGLLGDRSERLASEAAVALAKIGPAAQKAVPALTMAVQKGESPMADAAAFALGKMGPAAATAEPALRKTLKSPQPTLALVSAWALVQVRPGSAEVAALTVPVLTKGLEARVPKFRQGAAEALGSLGSAAKAALPALEKAAADKDKDVSQAAAKAIEAIKKPAQ